MFSNHLKLKSRTPVRGTDRRNYIGYLVKEYYTTTNIEAQEQVTANLANFAYDPINWNYLLEADAPNLFISLLEGQNENLQVHGIAGLCNFILDNRVAKFILEQKNIAAVSELFLRTKNIDIVLHTITLYLQLLLSKEKSDENCKQILVTPAILMRIQYWRQNSNDLRIVNICQVFVEDFGRRTEIIKLPNASITTPTMQSSYNKAATSSNSETIH